VCVCATHRYNKQVFFEKNRKMVASRDWPRFLLAESLFFSLSLSLNWKVGPNNLSGPVSFFFPPVVSTYFTLLLLIDSRID
jgi:hypothetical protein